MDTLYPRFAQRAQAKQLGLEMDLVVARSRGERLPSTHEYYKAAVPAGTTTQTAWGAPLVGADLPALRTVVAEQELPGRIGAFQAAPHYRIPGETSVPTAFWVAEGAAIPFASYSFKGTTLNDHKLCLHVAYSNELGRFGDPRSADLLVRLSTREIVRATDTAFLSDDAASDSQPAGLLNGVVPIIGGSPGDLLTDLELLYGTVTDGRPSAPAFVVSGRAAAYLAVHGGQIFRDVKARGVGMILGAPQYVCPAAANRLILIDSSEVAVADGGLEVDESGQVAVQMTDNPSGGASLVSAFQTGTRVARFIRSLTWAKLRDDAAGYVELGVLAGSPA